MSLKIENDDVIALLKVQQQPNKEAEVHPVSSNGTLRAGRLSANDIVLDDTEVSRFHAVFNASDSGIIMSDLSSLNGTLLNGERIEASVLLCAGDEVKIGNSIISVHMQAGPDSLGTIGNLSTQARCMEGVVVTVLIADVVAFTRLSETFPAKDVAKILQIWFAECSKAVKKWGGIVDKYIGDCLMAVWHGSPENAGELAEKAAHAGLSILSKTASLSSEGTWPHHHKMPWRCRVALNSGDALMGTLGGEGTKDYTVLGDTINVVFRLGKVGSSQDRDVILSASTAELIKSSFDLADLGEVHVAGRKEDVHIFTINDSPDNTL